MAGKGRGRATTSRLVLETGELLNLAFSLRGQPFDRALVERALARAGVPPLEHADGDRPICGHRIYRLLSATRDRKTAAKVQEILSPGLGRTTYALTQTYATAHFNISYDPTEISDMTVPSRQVTLYGETTVIGTLTRTDIPDYVQVVGIWLEYALARLTTPPFDFKNPSLQHPLEITLTDTGMPVAGYGGWTEADKTGRIWLYHSLDERLLSEAPAHELFHCVQGMYQPLRPINDSGPEDSLWEEGTATLVPDFLSGLTNSWMSWYEWYLARPWKSLAELSYPACGFWRYLCDQSALPWPAQDGNAAGVGVLRQCWESVPKDRPPNMQDLLHAVALLPPSSQSFADFRRSAPSGSDLLSNETLFGNWLVANWLKDYGDPVSDARFDFRHDEEPPGLGSVDVGTEHFIDALTGFKQPVSLLPWSAQYWIFQVESGAQSIDLQFTANAGADCLLQFVLLGDPPQIVDIIKSKACDYRRRISAHGVSRLAVVAAAASTAADCSIGVHPVPAAPDLMITRWDSLAGCEYEQDPRRAARTYESPDLWVDDGGGRNQVDLTANGNVSHLHVRVRNKGGAAANGVTIRFSQQVARDNVIRDDAWRPVTDGPAGDEQAEEQMLMLDVNGFSAAEGWVRWYVDEQAAAGKKSPGAIRYRWVKEPVRYAIKAALEHPDDGSPDNNAAITMLDVVCWTRHRVPQKPKSPKPHKPKHPKEKGKPKQKGKRTKARSKRDKKPSRRRR